MPTLTSSFAISYLNRANGAAITSTTAATEYPATNLSSSRLSSSWRSNTAALVSQNVNVDLGSEYEIDVIALIGTNLTNTATRSPVTAENISFTSPEYNPGSGNVFDNSYPDLVDGTRRYGRNLIVLPGETLESQYVRLTLSNSSNPDNYLSARVFWVGPIWQPSISFGISDGTIKKKKVLVGEPGIERALTQIEVSFGVLTEAEGVQLETLCASRLRSGRLLIIPRPDQPATWQSEGLYCTLVGMPELAAWPQGGGEIRWKVQLTFRECED